MSKDDENFLKANILFHWEKNKCHTKQMSKEKKLNNITYNILLSRLIVKYKIIY